MEKAARVAEANAFYKKTVQLSGKYRILADPAFQAKLLKTYYGLHRHVALGWEETGRGNRIKLQLTITGRKEKRNPAKFGLMTFYKNDAYHELNVERQYRRRHPLKSVRQNLAVPLAKSAEILPASVICVSGETRKAGEKPECEHGPFSQKQLEEHKSILAERVKEMRERNETVSNKLRRFIGEK
ncbi:MAG: hypothetical protein WC792_05920 [Candidatus Micrarchaeia archaeon]|jgi:hypothetical protein